MMELPSHDIEETVLRDQFERVMAASIGLRKQCQQKPALFQELLDSGDLQRSYDTEELRLRLQQQLSACDSRDQLHIILRQLRQREWARIVWRDLCRSVPTLETTRDMSLLAEACIGLSQDYLHRELEQEHGAPVAADDGSPQQMVVIAMGKLGARELNVSSDIDLIFTYPEAGKTTGSGFSNQEFFIRLGQRLIAALDQISAEGFVFRVDMRLRPYGQSGALVLNFAALEEYYQDQGRDWERYALVKARPVTGDPAQQQRLMDALRPFVYRRYIDFGVIDALRDMKSMIEGEVRRRGLQGDVKLGPGGIREVEFIAQCFQLIRGGRCRALQQRELLPVLDACGEEACLPLTAVTELQQAYLFLRDVEHAIQGYDDKQSQQLPSTPEAQSALLVALDFENWTAFSEVLDGHRNAVSGHFAATIAPAAEEQTIEQGPVLWPQAIDDESLQQAGFRDGEAAAQLLADFGASARVRYLQAESSHRLDQFMPLFLNACLDTADADRALARVLPLVLAVVRRSAYLVLLMENRSALQELVQLCAASPWISQQLERNPVLLDELLDTASLYSAPDKMVLRQALQQQISRLPEDDLEAQMDALRYFKGAQQLHVAASEISGRLPLMQVSDKLTFLAEVILEQALQLAWRELTSKHGSPNRDSQDSGFAIVAYGKLGGIELGHSSDLDLVFIYDAPLQGQTDGERPLDHTVFYTRLGQKIIHILDARTAMGQLYEIDMRLRPSGNSGMLVSSLSAYREYQQNSAWTWEHQALVRARFVAGDPQLGRQFDELRHELLAQQREPTKLAAEVVDMRDKMRAHLLSGDEAKSGEFHLKQGRGGIVDIEFLVQYAVLAWTAETAQLARWSDVVRILDSLKEAGRLPAEQADILAQAYVSYRSVSHQLALQQAPGEVSADQFREERAVVVDTWRALLEPG
jgi:glutamate-ammonia-ligase adenylyltransferase